MAVHRGPGRQDLGARILRTGFLLPAVLLVALAELPLLAIALIGDGDLVWVVVGSLIGLSLGGLGGSILVLFIAVGVMTWAAAPGGTSILARASGATLITSILVMAVGAAIGSRVEMEGSRGGFLSIIVALLGLKGDVRSAEWLWVARLAALVGILSLALMIRTFRKVPGFTTYMDPPARQREVD